MCRAESIEAVEHGVAALGLEMVVTAYLVTTFGARSLGELPDGDLARAMKFIAELEKQGPARPVLPIPRMMKGEGEIFWLRGRFNWGNG